MEENKVMDNIFTNKGLIIVLEEMFKKSGKFNDLYFESYNSLKQDFLGENEENILNNLFLTYEEIGDFLETFTEVFGNDEFILVKNYNYEINPVVYDPDYRLLDKIGLSDNDIEKYVKDIQSHEYSTIEHDFVLFYIDKNEDCLKDFETFINYSNIDKKAYKIINNLEYLF